MAVLRALAAEKAHTHRARFVGRTLEAITLNTPAGVAAQGLSSGLTENFLPVQIAGGLTANQLVRLRIEGLDADGTLQAGEPVKSMIQ